MADLLIEDIDEETLRRLREKAQAEGLAYYEVVQRAIVVWLDREERPSGTLRLRETIAKAAGGDTSPARSPT